MKTFQNIKRACSLISKMNAKNTAEQSGLNLPKNTVRELSGCIEAAGNVIYEELKKAIKKEALETEPTSSETGA